MVLYEQIEEALERLVRPMLHSHGGDVKLRDCRDGVVYISLTGACSGCPSADLSTRAFIEDMLTHELPEIKAVELEAYVDPELLDMAHRILRGEEPNAMQS